MRVWRTFFKNLIKSWSDDKVGLWAAALSFYALFSLIPLAYLLVSIGSLLLNIPTYEQSFFSFFGSVFGDEVSRTIRSAVGAVAVSNDNLSLAVVSFFSLALGATGIFLQAHDALRHIWQVEVIHVSWRRFLKHRLFALFLLVPTAILLLLTMLASTLVAAIKNWFGPQLAWLLPDIAWADFIISVTMTSFFTGLAYTLFAPKNYSRAIIWLAAVVVAGIFGAGRLVVGYYINLMPLTMAFGAASSLLILLTWIYFSVHIFLLGAEIAKAVHHPLPDSY